MAKLVVNRVRRISDIAAGNPLNRWEMYVHKGSDSVQVCLTRGGEDEVNIHFTDDGITRLRDLLIQKFPLDPPMPEATPE